MTMVPTLSTEALRLQPFTIKHLSEEYVSWLNDPEVVRYSEQRHRQHTLDSCRAFVQSFDTSPHQLWAIVDRASGQHLGNITATHDVNNRLADIGILIGAEQARGKGYGRAAWQLVLDNLKAQRSIYKVTGGCMDQNTAMLRIMERCGMQCDGRRHGVYLLDEQPVDLVYYSVRGAWQAGD